MISREITDHVNTSHQGSNSSRIHSQLTITGVAVLLGAMNVTALVVAPKTIPLLVVAVIVIPLIAWLFLTKNILTSFVLTTIGEMYSGGTGGWLSFGPLTIRWMLIFTTILVSVLVSMWNWRPIASRRYMPKAQFAMPILMYGGIIPLVLYAISMVSTNNRSGDAVASMGFMLVLMFYFPLRRAMHDDPHRTIWCVNGLSISLVFLILATAVGPASVREAIRGSMFPDINVGITATGISRIMPVHIVLLFFPAYAAILELPRVAGARDKLKYMLRGLFYMSPMIVTFLTGAILSWVLVLFLVGMVLAIRTLFRRAGKAIVLSVVTLAFIIGGVAMVITPDLLTMKASDRGANGLEGDERRLAQIAEAVDDAENTPWMGRGAGATFTSVTGQDEKTIELGGVMVFHRFGLVGCVVMLLGILLVVAHINSVVRMKIVYDRDMLVALAFWGSFLAISIAGMVNPYFNTPFPALFVCLYLAWYERVIRKDSLPPLHELISGSI